MCDHHFPGKVCIPDPAHIESDGTGVPVISLDANTGDVIIGGPPGGFGHRGRLVLTNADGDLTYEIDGETGTTSQSGDIVLLDADGNERVRISGQTAEVIIRSAAGDQLVHLDGNTGDVTVDGTTTTQDLTVNDMATTQDLTVNGSATTQDLTVSSTATTQDLTVNGTATSRDISVTNALGNPTIELDGSAADITLGGNGQHGDMIVTNNVGTETIRLNGEVGDIILSNADAAEHFDVVESADAVPGMLMVLNEEGKLAPSSLPYDSKVVGVVAGAGHYRPGIVLDHKSVPAARVPISVLGKVSCRADAAYGPIEVGSMLTTSPRAGHAMKASDRSKAFGAVIGKALTPLREGVGLVDVLITLQ